MRVISGIRKGHKLKAPDGLQTRPTTDRVKESVFNLIQLFFPANQVLDLFAGSGAMGIEALSRGARHAVFVEKNHHTFQLLKDNLQATRLAEFADLKNTDALRYLACTNEKFDLIFLDPPYNLGLLQPTAEQIACRKLLTTNGIIIAETEVGGEMFTHPAFSLRKQAKYGKTLISVLEYIAEAEVSK